MADDDTGKTIKLNKLKSNEYRLWVVVKVENVLHLRRVLGQTRAAKGRISETKVIGLRDGSSRNDGSSCNVSRRFRNFHDITGTPTEAVVATSAPT
jgi:hypothetical protein